MIDPVEYEEKPSGKEIGIIKNRISTLKPEVYSLESFKQLSTTGHTIIPSGIKSQKDWCNNENTVQAFLVDIDNTKKIGKEIINFTIEDKQHVTIEDILNYCNKINLLPTFIYYTFSHTEQQHKFRLVFITEPVNKKEEVIGINNFLIETFKNYNVDSSTKDLARIFFGGKALAYESENYYKLATVESTGNDEQDISQEISEMFENEELQQFSDCLKGTRYCINNGMLCSIGSKGTLSPIGNFIMKLTEKQIYFDGTNSQIKYKAECLLLDNLDFKLPALTLTPENINNFNFVIGSSWDQYAIVSAGANSRKT